MTNEEFNKIKSIKNKTDNLEKILYDNFKILENPKIQKLLILYTMFGDIDISILKELSDTILKIIEEKSEKNLKQNLITLKQNNYDKKRS